MAPPMEVPLRATQASAPMRKMMRVFRLNPFSMHINSSGTDKLVDDKDQDDKVMTWCGEARPLDEEPQILLWQLEDYDNGLGDTDGLDVDVSALRAFSPGFQLGEDLKGDCGIVLSRRRLDYRDYDEEYDDDDMEDAELGRNSSDLSSSDTLGSSSNALWLDQSKSPTSEPNYRKFQLRFSIHVLLTPAYM